MTEATASEVTTVRSDWSITPVIARRTYLNPRRSVRSSVRFGVFALLQKGKAARSRPSGQSRGEAQPVATTVRVLPLAAATVTCGAVGAPVSVKLTESRLRGLFAFRL